MWFPMVFRYLLQESSEKTTSSSFEQLLEDAKKMQEQELEDKKDDDSNSSSLINALGDSDGTSIKSVVGDALSALVTADFFLVCAFLVWFLVGIFCSSVLKNDFVQIQFNSKLLFVVVWLGCCGFWAFGAWVVGCHG